MNFEFMPELHYTYGYPVALLGMLVIALGLFLYMKSRKWF
jgi:magnesium transporter